MADYTRPWDRYIERDWQIVKERHGDHVEWPGDEWGNAEASEQLFGTLFVQHGGVDTWRRAVEIGQGSGKYTLKVLRNPDVAVRAYDVSAQFLDVCAERCREYVDSGRLSLRQIDTASPAFLLNDLHDWARQVDALYSIDAMVHVDLQYVMAYLITAAAVLRPGGKLVMTLASPTTQEGFDRLVRDVKWFWPHGEGRLEWVSAAMMESLLPRLGFEIDFLWEPPGFNLLLVASLARPDTGAELAQRIS
jgi:SAM-dependent methyltransferase